MTKNLGNTSVFRLTSTAFTNSSCIASNIYREPVKYESISIYHNGGTGSVLLGVYSDQAGSPAAHSWSHIRSTFS